MALLGFFSRKKSAKATPSKPSPNPSDSTSVAETDYVSVRRGALPQATNGLYNGPPAAAASSSKLRQAFARKKSPIQDDFSSLPSPPLLPYSPSAKSEADADHFPLPPSKTAIFSAYADPQGALSTRSLPSNRANHSHSRSNSREVVSVDAHANPDGSPPHPAKKAGGIFSWARDRKKSKPSDPPQPFPLSVDLGTESFNLKSFRHIGAEPASPIDIPQPPLPSPPLPPPLPHARPRGDSLVSIDSAQRVSVAAFREMAARSRNNSPSPSLRPPSTTDLSRVEPHPPSHRRPGGGTGPPVLSTRSSVANALYTSTDTESDEDSEDEDSDDSGGSETLRPKRNRTITQRSSGKASTELGHRIRTPPSAPPPTRTAKSKSSLGHGESPSPSPQVSVPLSKESKALSVAARTRASASTSALRPNAAAKRASMLAASKPIPAPAFPRKSLAISSSDSSESDSDDSDDAPLATFMNPKRPGSAASNATSGSRPRRPSKPLIDISAMSTPALSNVSSPLDRSPPPLPSQPEPPLPPLPVKTRPTHPDKPSLSDRLQRLAQNAGASRSVENLSVNPSERRSVDILKLESERERTKEKDQEKESTMAKGRAPPTRSQTAPMGSLDSPPASSPPSPTFSRPKRQSLSSPNAAAFDLTDTAPIIPRRIRERSPPPAFSVTSRPVSQLSVSSGHKLSNPPLPPPALIRGSDPATSSHTSNTSSAHHSHTSSTSTIRMLAASASVTTTTTTTSTTTSSSSTALSSSNTLSNLTSSSTPRPSIAPSSNSSTSSPSSAGSSSKPSTLAPPGNREPILRAPPPRTSSRQRASSTLVPHGGMPPSEAFTGGGLVSIIRNPDSNPKKSSPSSITPNANANTMSGSTGPTVVKTRQRSSTTIPMLDTGPSLSKTFSDYSSGVSGSGSSRYPFESGASSASVTSSSRGGGGGKGDAVPPMPSSVAQQRPSSSLAQPRATRPLLASSNANPSSGARSSNGTSRAPPSSLPYMIPSPSSGIPPPKPFAEKRVNSPASSTGDSSSGRTPLTPADGSDLGSGYSGGRKGDPRRSSGNGARGDVSVVNAGGVKGHRKTGSVGFQEPERERGRGVGGGQEERRKERRRGEAKAAIELGNVVNGRGPIADDDDEDVPLNNMGPRMSMVNPMFNLTPPSPMAGWRPPSAVISPQSFMFPVPPPNADPAFLVAHQQAMMVAKQAYQYAVAQQAMAQANEEWERGSSATSAFGGAGFGGMGAMGMGMPGAGGGLFPGYGMGMQPGWPNGMMFPSSAQSMYAPSVVAGSELGVNMGGGGGGWGSRSEYGGPTAAGNRNSAAMFRNSGVGFGQGGQGMMSSAQSHYGPLESSGRQGQRPRTKTAPSVRQGAPPSSWKSSAQKGA